MESICQICFEYMWWVWIFSRALRSPARCYASGFFFQFVFHTFCNSGDGDNDSVLFCGSQQHRRTASAFGQTDKDKHEKNVLWRIECFISILLFSNSGAQVLAASVNHSCVRVKAELQWHKGRHHFTLSLTSVNDEVCRNEILFWKDTSQAKLCWNGGKTRTN